MNQLNQLKNQHTEILDIIKESKILVNDLSDENKTSLAKNISRLAGILKIHLANEDRYLYPSFINSGEATLKAKSEAYQKEMGNLNTIFTEFKNSYNTKSKIDQKETEAKKAILEVFSAVEKRIDKEDHDLYILAEKLD